MLETPHLLICGDIGCGKSTLIQRLLSQTEMPVYGYITKRLESGADGLRPIYIHPAGEPEEDRVYTEENRIGACNRRIHDINLDAFNTLGVKYIRSARPDGVIVMDELGFMEAEAQTFIDTVFTALSGDTHVIAAVKSRTDVPLLDRIRSYPKARVFYISSENRDALYEELLPTVRAWSKR